jgi:hypothetical protein
MPSWLIAPIAFYVIGRTGSTNAAFRRGSNGGLIVTGTRGVPVRPGDLVRGLAERFEHRLFLSAMRCLWNLVRHAINATDPNLVDRVLLSVLHERRYAPGF